MVVAGVGDCTGPKMDGCSEHLCSRRIVAGESQAPNESYGDQFSWSIVAYWNSNSIFHDPQKTRH